MHDHDCGDCRSQQEIGAQDILLGSHQNDPGRCQNQKTTDKKTESNANTCLLMRFAPWVVVVEHARNRATSVSVACSFGLEARAMFWHLLPAPFIGGQHYTLPPSAQRVGGHESFSSTKKSVCCRMEFFFFKKMREETYTRDKILTQVWTSHVKDVLDVTHLIQTKA